MTITAIKFMFVLGIIGHALNMYCDRILSVFPNGRIMLVSCAFFCIVASGFHVKTALCEYVFLKLNRDERGKELMLDFLNTAPILRLCAVGLIVYIICLIIGTLHIASMISMLAWIFLI